jgi:beta-phosphoglucomutase-like phosphatase (HAD superfamily)
MIRVVVFDFDGTLVDSNGVKEACDRAVVAHLPGGPEALAKACTKGGNRYTVYPDVARLLDPSGDTKSIEAQGVHWLMRTVDVVPAGSWPRQSVLERATP